ncbi:MAG: HAD-IIB family hydrolase [Deltaproteobacteria bacterium]|nr:HAD-IIB family hydrolase [Deltaproteobacteria bacterium]
MAKIIMFTDLDGTLLHPKTYFFDAAMPALKLIKEKDIPLILCSSKTRTEIEVYRKKLDNQHPFISENGGGIFIPEGYFGFNPPKAEEGDLRDGCRMITLGKSYSEIRKAFITIRERLGIKAKGFGDMSVKEIAALAGLTLTEAELAKQREFDEPFLFEDLSPQVLSGEGEMRIKEFLKAIEDACLHWTQGRFYHILGDNDKGKAVRVLKGFYEKAYGRIKTIGLGDRFNDLPLLKQVDYPVLVQDEDGSYDARVNMPNLIRADGIGPEGWNKEVIKVIEADVKKAHKQYIFP